MTSGQVSDMEANAFSIVASTSSKYKRAHHPHLSPALLAERLGVGLSMLCSDAL